MTISVANARTLAEHGFTPEEISTIATAIFPDGSDQPDPDLSLKAWQDAMTEHHLVMNAFYQREIAAGREVIREDYNRFINDWYATVIKESDPWIWIDEFYFRTFVGVTKPRWEFAYKSIEELKRQVS